MKRRSAAPTGSLAKVILQELKQLLKQRKVQYQHLADYLGLSESGVKKLMNSKDCSLARMEQICEYLGVNLGDLLKNQESKTQRLVRFTPPQEKYFETHRTGFLVYWLLTYERREATEVKKLLKLSETAYFKVLTTLDRLGLVALLPGDRLRLPKPVPVTWALETSFAKNMYKKWGKELIEQAVDRHLEPEYEHLLIVRYFRLSEVAWKKFKAALAELETQMLNQGVSEMRIKDAQTKHIRWVSAMDRESWAEGELYFKNGK